MPVRSLTSRRMVAALTAAAAVTATLLGAAALGSGASSARATATRPAGAAQAAQAAQAARHAVAAHASGLSASPAADLAPLGSPAGGSSAPLATTPPGYTPANLRSAYNLVSAATTGGSGETVAIVSAFQYPTAAADLAVYRSHYKLPACSVASGCLRIRNEHGAASPLPATSATWAQEQAIQLDAISALCPRCRLLLVEAASATIGDLGTAETTAVSGARFVANGWGEPESADEGGYAHYFNHPGTAIVFASRAGGYGTGFPAALQYVTAVGGTTLSSSSFNSRGWAERAWAKDGSGCAMLEVKPSWQRADAGFVTGCANRTENDVSADADPGTGASVYDSAVSGHWVKAGGLSLAAAIVTATYALAGNPAPGGYPASYPYQHASNLFDIISGPATGSCGFVRTYLCTAERGFDGPTGLGTPNGTRAFSASGTSPVTLMDPGTQDFQAGTSVSIPLRGLDSRAGATALAFSASGLPAGLSVKPVAKSLNGVITGTLPPAVSSYSVTVTATDQVAGKAGSARFTLVAAGSLAPAAPLTARLTTGGTQLFQTTPGPCLDGGAGTAGTTVTVQPCDNAPPQAWSYQPAGAPGAPGTLTLGGLCLGAAIMLEACDHSDATQSWRMLPGALQDAGTGTCLTTATGRVNPVSLAKCDPTATLQRWWLANVELTSGVPGMCLAVSGAATQSRPWPVAIDPCDQSVQLMLTFNGSLADTQGNCLSGVSFTGCGITPDQPWLAGPGGQLIDQASGLCLDDPGNSATAGTELTLATCSGQLGEIWAVA